MEWLGEPREWQEQGGELVVRTDPRTDFWRTTHYGFVRDNGHFRWMWAEGNWQAEVRVAGEYRDQYDQAGLMVRLDERNWVKCGIEFFDGRQHLSVVVTRDYSDWSVVPLEGDPPAVGLRVVRQGDTVEVHAAPAGADYRLLRLAYLAPADRVQVGMMCASPEGGGFRVRFGGLGVVAREP